METRTARKLNRLASTMSTYPTFAALVAASKGGYTPTIRHPGLKAAVIEAGGKAWG